MAEQRARANQLYEENFRQNQAINQAIANNPGNQMQYGQVIGHE